MDHGQVRGDIIEENDIQETDVDETTTGSLRNDYYFTHYYLHLMHYFQVCFDAGISISEAQQHNTIG